MNVMNVMNVNPRMYNGHQWTPSVLTMRYPGLRRWYRHLVRRRQHSIPSLPLRGCGARWFHLHLWRTRRPDRIPQRCGVQISRVGCGGSLQRDDHHWRHWAGADVYPWWWGGDGHFHRWRHMAPKEFWQSIFTHQLLTLICSFLCQFHANSHMRWTQLQSLRASKLSW